MERYPTPNIEQLMALAQSVKSLDELRGIARLHPDYKLLRDKLVTEGSDNETAALSATNIVIRQHYNTALDKLMSS